MSATSLESENGALRRLVVDLWDYATITCLHATGSVSGMSDCMIEGIALSRRITDMGIDVSESRTGEHEDR